jgi:hypothetical protein
MRTDGIIALKRHLREVARAGKRTARVRVPFALAGKAAALYRDGEVLSRIDDEHGTELLVRAEGWQLEKLREAGFGVEPAGNSAPAQEASG